MKATAVGSAGGTLPSRRPESSSQSPVRESTYRAFSQDNSPMPREFVESPWYQAMLAAIRQNNARLDERAGTGRFFLGSP